MLCLVWNTFNIIILLSCLGVVWERRQVRGMHRYPTDEMAELEAGETGIRIPVKIVDLSISGIGLEVSGDEIEKMDGKESSASLLG